MKIRSLVYITLLLLFLGCNSENAGDCFQSAGDTVWDVVEVDDFSEIEIGEGVTLYLEQGDENKVVIETGENLLNDVQAYTENGKLILKDNNGCNFVRKYDVTKMHVTAVNINRIINNSQFNVYCEGVLTYSDLELVSENYNYESLATGSFYLDVQAENLQFTFNQWSSAFVSGTVTNLTINFYSGDSRFEGEGLIAQHIAFYHRSSNDIIVYPVQSISGQIVSTGNVIAVNTPPVVDVSTPYIGNIIFTD